MGLAKLEWFEQAGGWIARAALPYDTSPVRTKFRRVAHIDIYPFHVQPKKGKHYVHLQNYFGHGVQTETWHDSVEAAKLHVEAIFALDND